MPPGNSSKFGRGTFRTLRALPPEARSSPCRVAPRTRRRHLSARAWRQSCRANPGGGGIPHGSEPLVKTCPELWKMIKHHYFFWKNTLFLGKSDFFFWKNSLFELYERPFSITMLVYQRVGEFSGGSKLHLRAC